jgi:hypothetical protein
VRFWRIERDIRRTFVHRARSRGHTFVTRRVAHMLASRTSPPSLVCIAQTCRPSSRLQPDPLSSCLTRRQSTRPRSACYPLTGALLEQSAASVPMRTLYCARLSSTIGARWSPESTHDQFEPGRQIDPGTKVLSRPGQRQLPAHART